MACYGDSFTFLYVDYVRTSRETHPWSSTACYGNNFTFLYVDYVRTSRETHPWTSTACFGDNFTFLYVDYVRTSRVTPIVLHGLALLCFYRNKFIPQLLM
jgi:hypothetical protein